MLQTIRYKHGRILSYAEYGNPGGFPILVQHGLIASIKDDALFHRLIDLGARLICMARPGYGESSPYVMKNIGEWAEIASALIAELQLAHFDVLGMSSGAPYAYALGYWFPDRARTLYIFSGIPALYDAKIQAVWPHPLNRESSLPELQKLAHELFFANLTPDDLQKNDIHDSMRNDCFGIALDFKLRCLDWGFVLADIKAPVYMQHSRFDLIAGAELTSRLLPNCRLSVIESDVHFSAETLDDFIREIIAPFYD
jgi:pimeloyl-ACP methyl ester carboxylesterase